MGNRYEYDCGWRFPRRLKCLIMYINKYGVILRRLELRDIELVRYWRNHQSIQKHMVIHANITRENQYQWFESINNSLNFYFIIEYNGNSVGLVNGKDYMSDKQEMEVGIFIWDTDVLTTFVPVSASLCSIDFGFYIYQLKKIRCTILNRNQIAINYNKQLGFEKDEDQANDMIFSTYSLYPDVYSTKTKKLKSILQRKYRTQEIVLESNKSAISDKISDFFVKYKDKIAPYFSLKRT